MNKPIKPIKPQKVTTQTLTIIDCASDHSIETIVDIIKSKEPDRPLSDFYIDATYQQGYYDEIEIMTPVVYSKEIVNKKYDKQLKLYKEKLKLYNERTASFNLVRLAREIKKQKLKISK